MKLPARFDRGRLVLDPVAVAIAAQEFRDKRLVITLDVDRPVRSIQANKRWWGVIIPLVQHCLDAHPSRQGLPPLSDKQAHCVAVSAFAGQELTPLGPAPVETHTMDSKQFAILQERTEQWLAEQGYVIPDGDAPVNMDGAA